MRKMTKAVIRAASLVIAATSLGGYSGIRQRIAQTLDAGL